MKIQSVLAFAALVGVFATASAITTVAPDRAAASPVTFEAPVPTKIIQPIELPPSHAGSLVNLTMTIDATGKPRNVRVVAAGNQEAYRRIIATVSKWEFAPARKNGQAVPARIELPLEVKGL
jgi:periplasmic protein TonB